MAWSSGLEQAPAEIKVGELKGGLDSGLTQTSLVRSWRLPLTGFLRAATELQEFC